MSRVGDLPWDAVAARIAAGALAVLPIGAGAKQHGLHLPMATDALQAEWLAARLAERFDALIWPTLSYGYYPAFVGYAGSASLSVETFEAVVREIATAILGYGPRVLVLDTGISTVAPVARALDGLAGGALHLRVYAGRRYRAAAEELATQAHGGHADELETSNMLAIAPDLVAMARAEASPPEPPGPGPMQRANPRDANYSGSGSIGDPSGASRAKGEALLAAMLDDLTETVSAWMKGSTFRRQARSVRPGRRGHPRRPA